MHCHIKHRKCLQQQRREQRVHILFSYLWLVLARLLQRKAKVSISAIVKFLHAQHIKMNEIHTHQHTHTCMVLATMWMTRASSLSKFKLKPKSTMTGTTVNGAGDSLQTLQTLPTLQQFDVSCSCEMLSKSGILVAANIKNKLFWSLSFLSRFDWLWIVL